MDKAEAEQLISELQVHYKKLDKICESLSKTIGLSPECDLYEVMWNLISITSKSIALNIGISPELLDWFIHDNAFGKRKLKAYDGDKAVIIDSIKAFLEFKKKIK